MDITNGRGATGENDDSVGIAIDNGGSREDEVDLFLLDRMFIRNCIDVLGDTLTLTGQDGLVDAEAVAVNGQQATVRGDTVTDSDLDNISGHQIFRLDALDGTITNDLGFVRRVFLEGSNGFFGAAFLGDTNDGIEDKNRKDLCG